MTIPGRIAVAVALLAGASIPSAARAQQHPDSTSNAPRPTTPPSSTPQRKPDAPPATEPKAKAAAQAPAPGLNFGAWAFGSYSIQTDSATKATNGGQSKSRFDVGRVYLTFQGSVGDRTSFRVTTDVKQNANGALYNGWFVRLKYAYLQYNFLQSGASSSGLNAWGRIGMLHTVIIDHEEGFWPRYLGTTAPERAGFFSSSDVGIGTGWTLPNKMGEIYGTVTNGSGYENPEADGFKDLGLRLSLTPLGSRPAAGGSAAGSTKPLLSTFTISPWVYIGQKASKFLVSDSITDGLKRNRFGVFVGLKDPRLTAGAEWGGTQDETEAGTIATRSVVSTTGRLVDGFVIVRPTLIADPARKANNIGLIGRFDHFTPNTDSDGHQNFFIAGLFWEPTPKAAIALDYQRQESKGYPLGSAAPATQNVWYLHWTVTF